MLRAFDGATAFGCMLALFRSKALRLRDTEDEKFRWSQPEAHFFRSLAWSIIMPGRSTAMSRFLIVSAKESGERTLMTPLFRRPAPPMALPQKADESTR